MAANNKTTLIDVHVKYLREIGYDNLLEWTADPNNVYIGRGGIVFVTTANGKERYPKKDSIWANPFKVKDGDNLDDILIKYKAHLLEKIAAGEITVQDFRKLEGKTLGCWCIHAVTKEVTCTSDPDEKMVCHGQVIMSMMKEIIPAKKRMVLRRPTKINVKLSEKRLVENRNNVYGAPALDSEQPVVTLSPRTN